MKFSVRGFCQLRDLRIIGLDCSCSYRRARISFVGIEARISSNSYRNRDGFLIRSVNMSIYFPRALFLIPSMPPIRLQYLALSHQLAVTVLGCIHERYMAFCQLPWRSKLKDWRWPGSKVSCFWSFGKPFGPGLSS
jgi:hypothetical protein